MSWFNFNDSLNNIKGQISSLASEVLSDGTANVAEPGSTVQELHELLSRKEAEIQSLRTDNELLFEKLQEGSRMVKENEAGNDDGWSWDTPNHTENTAKTISDLKKKLEILESEKSDLMSSLEQLDSDCQQATDKLVAIKDELQIEHNKLKLEFEDLKKKNDFLNKINDENQKKITTLERATPHTADATSITIQNSHLEEKLQQLKIECENFKNVELKTLKKKFHDLKVVTKKIKHLRDKQNDAIQPEDYTKLENILHEYEIKVTTYEQELTTLRSTNSELQQKLAINQTDIKKFQTSIQNLTEENTNLKTNIKAQSILLDEIKKKNIVENNDIIINLQNELSRMKTDNEKLVEEKYKCINILKDSILKCAEVQFPEESGDSTDFAYYMKIVESIVKLILNYKWKCETLDKEVINLTEEKTRILTEKNHEIEKLIRNSEELSNEIIIKTQDLKHYEDECAELIKNNELLIARLDEFKNVSSLQTISETNEENMLQLENQLDKSNKRIEELEFVIAEIDVANTNLPSTSKSELEYVKEQLSLTGNELNYAKKKYEELANSYQKLENDNDSLKSNLEDMKVNFKECYIEKEDLNVAVDQMKSECENTEYKYAEQNINLETLKEEVETHIQTIESLTSENKKLLLIRADIEGKNELMAKEIEDLKQELTATLELTEQKDVSIEALETSKDLQLTENVALKEEIKNLKESLQENVKSSEKLQETIAEKNQLLDKIKHLSDVVQEKNNIAEVLEKLREDYKILTSKYEEISNDREKIQNDFENFKASVAENNRPNEDAAKITALEAHIVELTTKGHQLVEFIQEKQQENVNYHAEIQRLQQVLSLEVEKSRTFEAQLQNLNATTISAEELAKKDEEIEKLSDQNNFLREKCSKLAENLLEEQSNVQKVIAERSETSEREINLQKKLDELRHHLVEVQDYYTKEVRAAEQTCEDMQKKLYEIEQREKNSSNRYTSVNIRANQQVETLQTQLQLVTNQRDDLKNKLSDYEDEINKQKAALTNLHSAFQQFQREKDTEIQIETERIRRQVTQEKKAQENLQKEIGDLRAQLEESKQGLKAAVRLSDQVDASKRQVTAMKDEVTKLQQQLAKSEEKYNKYMNQSDGKVDKMLIKNLIIGLISTNNNLTKDQNQILKIISTVLDFNQQDIEKVKLNKNQQNSWFSSLLHPQVLGGQNFTQESLSLAFVKFLEAESKPRELPNLLDSASAVPGEIKPSDSSRSSSVRQSPILLNEIVLPTFADFGQNRNSSSILKDVLKDNTNS